MHSRLAIAVLTLFILNIAPTSADEPPKQLDLRTPDGALLIPADQIIQYRWPDHVLTLQPGVRQKLFNKLKGTLVSGVPFVVAVDGAPIYQGVCKSCASSISAKTPVIVLDQKALDADLADDQIRIDLGYPTPKFFVGDDPRGDDRIHAALRASGKRATGDLHLNTDAGYRTLTGAEARDYATANAWMEQRWKEIEKIKPGSTYAELANSFRHDGGLSEVDKHRYVLILCPIFKINVTFENNPSTPIPADAKIATVSAPYFEREFAD